MVVISTGSGHTGICGNRSIIKPNRNDNTTMEVNLVNYSKADGSYLIESASAKEMIAFCARVSNPENQFNEKTSDKLIKYLIKHQHWSPFEMVSACLEIKTTRDIARQILRHRSFSFQEFSQRYAQATDFVVREARLQDETNRQNSSFHFHLIFLFYLV